MDQLIGLHERRHVVERVKDCVDEGDLTEAFLGIIRIMSIDEPNDSIGKHLSVLQAAALKRQSKLNKS